MLNKVYNYSLSKNSEKIRQNLSMWEDHYNKKK